MDTNPLAHFPFFNSSELLGPGGDQSYGSLTLMTYSFSSNADHLPALTYKIAPLN